MGVLNISIPMAKQRALAKAILAVMAVTAFIVGCSSAAARTGQRLFQGHRPHRLPIFARQLMPRLGNRWPTQRPTLQGFLALEAQPLRSFLLLPLKPATLLRRLGEAEGTATPGPTGL